VQTVVASVGVSESDFREVFSTLEACYYAAYKQGLERLSCAVAAASGHDQSWLERVRSGLVAMLGFFDDEPAWARLLVLETPSGGARTPEHRRELYGVLIALLDPDGDPDAAAGSAPRVPVLTGELVAGGVFSVIRSSMLEDDDGRLVELAPSLVAFVAAQYGLAAMGGEHAPANERARAISRAVGLPIRATRRTTLVLRAIAQTPYSNNREVARAAGLTDEGQASKLLSRLERQGVIENVGVGAARGEPNAWLLTESGKRAVKLINEGFGSRATRPSSARARGVA
jgi:AcrR family transcriptional regulator